MSRTCRYEMDEWCRLLSRQFRYGFIPWNRDSICSKNGWFGLPNLGNVEDGETQEGQIWEAFMAVGYHNLDNLHVIIDRNRIQNDDFVNVQMEIGDVASKVEAFGWSVKEIDGHDMEAVVEALQWSWIHQVHPP